MGEGDKGGGGTCEGHRLRGGGGGYVVCVCVWGGGFASVGGGLWAVRGEGVCSGWGTWRGVRMRGGGYVRGGVRVEGYEEGVVGGMVRGGGRALGEVWGGVYGACGEGEGYWRDVRWVGYMGELCVCAGGRSNFFCDFFKKSKTGCVQESQKDRKIEQKLNKN